MIREIVLDTETTGLDPLEGHKIIEIACVELSNFVTTGKIFQTYVNPEKEIRELITWLGWEWNDLYLVPHLNKRSVSTASSVQVRSPINSNSLYGWQNYRGMLEPAIDIITNTEKYQEVYQS